MEIGNQIKLLRQWRGITQEEMAQHFGITAQAVSKWERGAATPDIALLPEISAYFGVTIDELFALSRICSGMFGIWHRVNFLSMSNI